MPTTTYNPAATLTGTTQAGSGAYGGVPAAASTQATQLAALLGNIGVAGNLTGLATDVGQASAAGAQAQLAANLPGYSGMTTQASQNIAADLAGQISPDVLALLEQSGAERGINVGGGPNAQAAILRAMGETSQQRQALGQQELTSAIARTPTGQNLNVASMLVTPAEQLTQQQLANTLASAPSPSTAAYTNLATLQEALKAGQKAGTAGGYTITPNAPAAGAMTMPMTPSAPSYTGAIPAGAGAGTTLTTTGMTAADKAAAGTGLDLSGLGGGFDPTTGTFTGGTAATGQEFLSPAGATTGARGMTEQEYYDYYDMGAYGDYGGEW